MNPFTWLRTAARNAVLGGIQDALSEAAPSLDTITVGGTLLAIPDRAAPAPPTGDAPVTGRKKKVAG